MSKDRDLIIYMMLRHANPSHVSQVPEAFESNKEHKKILKYRNTGKRS
jgi:hypothetical protein